MKRVDTYLDYCNNKISLTKLELEYFYNIVKHIKTTLNIDHDIFNCDHEAINRKNALGCCHTQDFKKFIITIDNYFIHECFTHFVLNDIASTWFLNDGKTIESVICHELAHILQWRHCKRHKLITEELLEKVNK